MGNFATVDYLNRLELVGYCFNRLHLALKIAAISLIITAVASFTLEIRVSLSSGCSDLRLIVGPDYPEKTISLVRPSEVMTSITIYYQNFCDSSRRTTTPFAVQYA